MLETCKSCGTVFEVNESILTEKIQWFKCGVCSKKWSSSSNLYINHVLHSLAIAKVVNFKSETKILDLGTGGGFPGIPLAILFPQANLCDLN